MKFIEIWKDIKEYERLYQVSSLGRVKSLKRFIIRGRGGLVEIKEKILKFHLNQGGYYMISLHKNGISNSYLVHRLVAHAFITNSENKPQINHKDGNKSNNNIKNLEWVTAKENSIHSTIMGLNIVPEARIGEDNYWSKLTGLQIKEIRRLSKTYTRREIAKKFNVGPTTITNIVNRKKWKHI